MAKDFEPGPRFGVFVENPNKIYATIREDLISGRGYRNITALMKDPKRSPGAYYLSKTDLKTPLLDQEETSLFIVTDWGPFCSMDSEIFLSDEALSTAPHGFYSRQRRSAIRQILAAQGIPAEWDENFRNLQVKRLNEVVVTIDFGWMNGNERLKHLKEILTSASDRRARLRELGAPQVIIDHEEKFLAQTTSKLEEQKNQPTNESIKLHLKDIWKRHGGTGSTSISFRRPEAFAENLRFYASVYEALIKALHQEASLPNPESPIYFSLTSLRQETA